jgi:hypothetical protein
LCSLFVPTPLLMKTNLSSEARSPLRRSWPVRTVAKRGIRCHITGAGGYIGLCIGPPHHLRAGLNRQSHPSPARVPLFSRNLIHP